MFWIFFFATLAACCCIAWQDLRDRSVSWILFPGLALCGILISTATGIGMRDLLQRTGVNLLFVAAQLVMVQGYFWLRDLKRAGGRYVLIIDRQLGSGDILFLLASCCFFSTELFLAFYVLSLCVTLAGYLLLPRLAADKGVPLAGIQSLCLIVFVCAGKWLSL